MEPWRAVDAHNGCLELETQKWSPGGRRVCRPVVADSYHFVEEQDLDRISIRVKSWIRIRIKVIKKGQCNKMILV